jgi:hypothetical protein
MSNEIATGASGVLKDTCQFDDRRDAHLHLSNSKLDTVNSKNRYFFKNGGTYCMIPMSSYVGADYAVDSGGDDDSSQRRSRGFHRSKGLFGRLPRDESNGSEVEISYYAIGNSNGVSFTVINYGEQARVEIKITGIIVFA